jgi:hypothetical protein
VSVMVWKLDCGMGGGGGGGGVGDIRRILWRRMWAKLQRLEESRAYGLESVNSCGIRCWSLFSLLSTPKIESVRLVWTILKPKRRYSIKL